MVTWVSPKSHDKCHTEDRLTEERGEDWVKTEVRWSHVATTKEHLGPPEPGRGKGGLSLTASGQWRLADALILNFWLLELSENEFLLFFRAPKVVPSWGTVPQYPWSTSS